MGDGNLDILIAESAWVVLIGEKFRPCGVNCQTFDSSHRDSCALTGWWLKSKDESGYLGDV
jgi:hypothetical protein